MVPEARSAENYQPLTAWINTDGAMSVRVLGSGSPTVTVQVAGEVDLNSARKLDEVLQARIGSTLDEVVIDLAAVTFFSVAGLNCLLRARLLADVAGACLTVSAGRSYAVQRFFDLLPEEFDGFGPRAGAQDSAGD